MYCLHCPLATFKIASLSKSCAKNKMNCALMLLVKKTLGYKYVYHLYSLLQRYLKYFLWFFSTTMDTLLLDIWWTNVFYKTRILNEILKWQLWSRASSSFYFKPYEIFITLISLTKKVCLKYLWINCKKIPPRSVKCSNLAMLNKSTSTAVSGIFVIIINPN